MDRDGYSQGSLKLRFGGLKSSSPRLLDPCLLNLGPLFPTPTLQSTHRPVVWRPHALTRSEVLGATQMSRGSGVRGVRRPACSRPGQNSGRAERRELLVGERRYRDPLHAQPDSPPSGVHCQFPQSAACTLGRKDTKYMHIGHHQLRKEKSGITDGQQPPAHHCLHTARSHWSPPEAQFLPVLYLPRWQQS